MAAWEEVSVAKADRGFASMDRVKRREIASKGGKAAQEKGTAHRWTSEEARVAGHRGGLASHRRRLASSDDKTGVIENPPPYSGTPDGGRSWRVAPFRH